MRRWQRPGLLAIALALFGLGAFGMLGVWQLRRGDEKERLFAGFADAARSASQPLTDALAADPAARFPHVEAQGEFDAVHSYLFDERMHGGRAGVDAVGVFR